MRWGRLRSGLFGFGLRFGSVTGRSGHAPSLSLAKTSNILAPHGYSISSNALACNPKLVSVIAGEVNFHSGSVG
jgi:hypothetical protein